MKRRPNEIIASVSSDTFKDEFSYEKAYVKLRSEYPDYSLLDCLVLYKLRRYYETGIISGNLYDDLNDLYDLRVQTNKAYWDAFGNEDDKEETLAGKLFDIDVVFARFGIYPDSLKSLFDHPVNTNLEVDEEEIKQLIIGIKKDS